MKFYRILSLPVLLGLVSIQAGYAQFGGGVSVGYFRTNYFFNANHNGVVSILGDYSFSDKWTIEIGESFVRHQGLETTVTGFSQDTTVSPSMIFIRSMIKIPQFIIYARVNRYFGKNKSWYGSVGTDFVTQIAWFSVGKYDKDIYEISPYFDRKDVYFHGNLKLSLGKTFKIGKVNLFAETQVGIPFAKIKNTIDVARGLPDDPLAYVLNRYCSLNMGVKI
ncbi:hypothetical protein [Parvicella tangerina]|uniref:Uncharacterized protein n=1 Tax=Parvicella tangerina TaxID=2829795 RepID=A0A916NAM2_9FLAO|nr:hypothetical protein [Parvicella tangerina]CAG5080981.1 hypothetical protein CRYO30217_01503 [Parvicella tangerina]